MDALDLECGADGAERVDALRLVALSRIERCGRCPRLPRLVAAHRDRTRLDRTFPGRPEVCSHEVCAPLVRRLRGQRADDRPAA